MNEENLFNIQTEQLNQEIKKIKWIVKNSDQLIRAIRKEVTDANAEYFNDENASVDSIFRGVDFDNFITNYISIKL
jgi:hypothetical protein